MEKVTITILVGENDLVNKDEILKNLKEQFGENFEEKFNVVFVNEKEANIKWISKEEEEKIKNKK